MYKLEQFMILLQLSRRENPKQTSIFVILLVVKMQPETRKKTTTVNSNI